MKDHEVKALLQETLEDYQLTKKERNELRDLLDNVRGDEQRRALYRSMAFDAAREALAKADAGQRFQVLDWLEGTVKTLHPTENLPAGGKREGQNRTLVRMTIAWARSRKCLARLAPR